MKRPTYSSALSGNLRRFPKSQREKPKPPVKLPKLPSTAGLLLRLKEHTRREWVTTPIRAPHAPCWANAALSVFLDVCDAYDRYV